MSSVTRQGTPDVILIGTGSELQLALDAQEKLAIEGVKARVVSMPCWDLFEEQSAEYKESVLPSAVRARVAVEAGIPIGWERYVGLEGKVVGQSSSAPRVRQRKFSSTSALPRKT